MLFELCGLCVSDECGLCWDCSVKYDICLNCIDYGEGGECANCLTDEGVSLDFEIAQMHEAIRLNDLIYELTDEGIELYNGEIFELTI